MCNAAPKCGAGSVSLARTGNAPCIFDLGSEGDTNGVCVADTIADGRTWYHCVQCASAGCGRLCFDAYETGFVSRGDVMPCTNLAHLCNTTSARASLGSITPDPATITAVRSACRATCGLCRADPSMDTVESLDPLALPSIVLMNDPTAAPVPTTALTTTPISSATLLGCRCRAQWMVASAVCKDVQDAQYSGCGMQIPCDSDDGGGQVFSSWCYTEGACGFGTEGSCTHPLFVLSTVPGCN